MGVPADATQTQRVPHLLLKKMNSAQYWIKLRLPYELEELNMRQLTALRKMVQNAFTAGKRDERKAKVKDE